MAIVGFNFTKISAERKIAPKGKIGIKNNVSVQEVEKTDLFLGSMKQNGLKIIFEYRSIYEPKIGEILLEGEILDLEDEKIIDDILKGWKIWKYDNDSRRFSRKLTPCTYRRKKRANIFCGRVLLPLPLFWFRFSFCRLR